ncbi:MAG: phage virion morphogenesis protein [Pseudomonadota bacterium]
MAKRGVRLEWNGFDKMLSGLEKRIENKGELLENIGEVLVSGTMKRFSDEEDPEGGKWPKSKRAVEQEGQTLVDTASLRNSIDRATTSSSVMVGSNLPYARIHQKGGKAGRGHSVTLPARPYLGISKDDHEEIQGTIVDWMKGK